MRTSCVLILLGLLIGCGGRTSGPQPIVTVDTVVHLLPTDGAANTDTSHKISIGDSVYYPAPGISALRGKLIQKVFWGQPGFGEDTTVDAKWTFFVIVLDKPMTYIPDKYELSSHIDTIYGLDSIQIEDQRGNPKLLAKVGKKATFVGTLSAAIAPSQCTPVTLDFKDVK